MREEDWPTTPEGIAALVAKMEQIEPIFTDEEYEAWRKALAEQKAWRRPTGNEDNEKIRKIFE